MAYSKSKSRAPVLIARRGYGGLGDVGGFLKTLFNGYNAAQQQVGASNQAALDTQHAVVAQSGPSTTDLLLIGGVAVGAIVVLTRKKRAA